MPHKGATGNSARAPSSNPRSCLGESTLRPKIIIPPGLTSSISLRVCSSTSVPGKPIKKNCPTCCSRGRAERLSEGIDDYDEFDFDERSWQAYDSHRIDSTGSFGWELCLKGAAAEK